MKKTKSFNNILTELNTYDMCKTETLDKEKMASSPYHSIYISYLLPCAVSSDSHYLITKSNLTQWNTFVELEFTVS